MTDLALSWMLTYLLHSSLLLGAAWLASKLLADEALAVKETLWRVALLGALATATLQVGLGVEPRLGGWSVAARDTPAAPVGVARFTPREAHAAVRPAGRDDRVDRTTTAVVERPRQPLASPPIGAAEPAPRAATAAPRAWGRGALALWALGALALTARLALACVALARRLADRRPIAGGGLQAFVARLLAAARMTGVRLSATPRIASPLAFGWRRPEICLPERMASEMSVEQQELVLAHELAHHARRDPLWLIVARLIESVLFFQPLNRLASRRLQEIAEYRCDDWAVERTGRPITLARCLADVAEWSLRRGAPLPVPTLAVQRRRLSRRVERLLDRSYPYPEPGRPRWLTAGVAAALVLVVLLAPGVSSGHATPPPEAPEAAPATEDPEAAPSPEAPPAPPAPAASPAAAPTPALAPRPELPFAPPPALAPAPPPAPEAEAPAPPAPLAPPTARLARPAAAPQPPVLPAPPRPGASVAPVVPGPPAAPPLAPLRPTERLSAPAPPAAPVAATPADGEAPAPENGGWVLHDAPPPGPTLAPVAVARLADIDDRAKVAAELMAFDAELAELAESHAVSSERLLELSHRMAEAARPDPAAMDRVARLSAELAARTRLDPELAARIAALSHELAGRGLADDGTRALLEDYARRAAADEELSEEERSELARLREEIQRQRARWLAVEREEMARLREEIRRQVEASRPDREEMARLREEIRRELEAAGPDHEEMARLREEIGRELEASRPDREEMRRAHEEARRALRQRLEERERSERYEAGRAETLRREERDLRELEELRAEVERLREELRRARAGDDGGDRF